MHAKINVYSGHYQLVPPHQHRQNAKNPTNHPKLKPNSAESARTSSFDKTHKILCPTEFNKPTDKTVNNIGQAQLNYLIINHMFNKHS